jgi:hypothetical protein
MARTAARSASRGLADRYLELLAEEGYRPRLERHPEQAHLSRIEFKVEGVKFNVFLDEEDPAFFQLSLAFDLGARSFGDTALLAAANHLNDEMKAVKATIDRDANVARFHYEAFVEGPPSSEILGRSMFQLRRASDDFFERIRPVEAPTALA